MTSDVLHASIAACLVQANLSFVSLLGQTGDKPIRIFQMEFGQPPDVTKSPAGPPNRVTGYVAGSVFIVVAPMRILDLAKRLELSDSIATKFPMVRLQPSPAGEEPDIIWAEASVPVPQIDNNEPVMPWLVVPPFMAVASAVNALLANHPGWVSLPEKRPTLPIMAVSFAQPSAEEPAGSATSPAKPAA